MNIEENTKKQPSNCYTIHHVCVYLIKVHIEVEYRSLATLKWVAHFHCLDEIKGQMQICTLKVG